jgi:hypothetical protein
VLLIILIYPVLDHDGVRRLVLGVLMFVPVILATFRLSQIKGWVLPSVLLMSGASLLSLASTIFPNRTLTGMKWVVLAAFFALTVVGLFSYLRNTRIVLTAHLYTAISIYLLLGMQWFAVYSAIDVFRPGSFLFNKATIADRQSELLYFSLVLRLSPCRVSSTYDLLRSSSFEYLVPLTVISSANPLSVI